MDKITIDDLVERYFSDAPLCKRVAFVKDLESVVSGELSGHGILTREDAEKFHASMQESEKSVMPQAEYDRIQSNYKLFKSMEQKGLGVSDEQIEAMANADIERLQYDGRWQPNAV